MPKGRNYGYKRNVRSSVPFGFARKVREVSGTSKHVENRLVGTNDRSISTFNLYPGENDHCLVLPVTELCRNDIRSTDTVVSRGGGVKLELTATRGWAVRVIGFTWWREDHGLVTAADDGGSMSYRDAVTYAPWGDLSSTGSLGYRALLDSTSHHNHSYPLLHTLPGTNPIFFPVQHESKRRVVLDRVFRGRGSTNYVDVRPIIAWIDYKRQLQFINGTGFCWSGNMDNRVDLFIAIIVSVPSFVFERVAAALPDIGQMEVDDKENEGSSKGKFHVRAASEAPTVLLDRRPRIPVVEITNIWSRFYWRETVDPPVITNPERP